MDIWMGGALIITPTIPYLLAAARLLVLAVTFVIMCEVAAGEGGAILRLALNVWMVGQLITVNTPSGTSCTDKKYKMTQLELLCVI